MNTARVWLFRGLVIIGAALLVISWFQPWWAAHCVSSVAGDHTVTIHPWGLDGGGLEGYFKLMPGGGAEVAMPAFLTPAMWAYFGLALAALLLGIIFNKKNIILFGKTLNLSRWLVGIVGFSYIAVCAIEVIIAYIKVSALTMPFIGNAWVDLGEFAMWKIELDVTAWIPLGYWLAWAAGIVLFVTALLRNKIIGKSE